MARKYATRFAGQIPEAVFLYRDPFTTVLDPDAIASNVRALLGLAVHVRGEFLAHHAHGDLEALARRLASSRVRHPDRPPEDVEPVYGETQFELRHLETPSAKVAGVLYDAHRLSAVCRERLPPEERTLRAAHVVLTSRLFATFGEDGRYHARVNLCGFPSLVSTAGIVEAPAKPKEYYAAKARVSTALGSVPFEALKEPFRGRFVDYDDPRLTEVLTGYVLQCLVYHIAGEAFCEDPACRLFNAHWQSEVLRAQIESGALCRRHASLAASIRAAARKS